MTPPAAFNLSSAGIISRGPRKPQPPLSRCCCCCYRWCEAGPDAFRDDILKRLGGPESADQFDKLLAECQPLMEAASALPSLSLRSDKWAAVTMLRYRSHGKPRVYFGVHSLRCIM